MRTDRDLHAQMVPGNQAAVDKCKGRLQSITVNAIDPTRTNHAFTSLLFIQTKPICNLTRVLGNFSTDPTWGPRA